MAGIGPPPAAERRRRNVPARGEFQAAPGLGWQHGEIPRPPARLFRASRVAWQSWFESWFASHWTEHDLPGLRTVVMLYDQVQRGEFQRAGELRLSMDTYGITPKGQLQLRWAPPKADEQPAAGAPGPASRYAGLRVIAG